MENQHQKIKGYRDLHQGEIDAMNNVKHHGQELENLISSLEMNEEIDKRWLNIARTQLQQGLMALVRSIAKPESF